MSLISLKVILHGLIALVPTVDPSGGHLMTALLLDARTPSGVECMATHNPKLTFTVPQETQSQCADAGCDLTGLQCDCTDGLTRRKISLEITPAPNSTSPLPQSTNPLPEIPADALAAGDFSYVSNLSQQPFGQVLNPAYLLPSPPPNLLARMEVPFNKVTACALAAREDKGESHVQPFSFHKLHRRGKADEASQAIAQMVVANLDIQDAGQGTQQVRLHISDLDGAHDKSVILAPSTHGYMIDISNDTTVLDRDDPCDDGVGRHFALYYDLAVTPPPMADRLIPHARFVVGKKADDLALPECAMPVFNPMDRPVCPVATFKP